MLPITSFGRFKFHILFFLTRRNALAARYSKLYRSNTIYAARWVVVPPFVHNPRLGRRSDHGYHLLFESNYCGDWDDYLDVFTQIIPKPMGWIFGSARGFPGMQFPERFKAYARSHDHIADLYYCAYPSATVGEILQALRMQELDAQLIDFPLDAERAHGDSAQWSVGTAVEQRRTARREILDEARWHEPEFRPGASLPLRQWKINRELGWLVFNIPVRPECVGRLRTALAEAEVPPKDGTQRNPFETPWTHFGRCVVLDRGGESFMLCTVVFDAGPRRSMAGRDSRASRYRWFVYDWCRRRADELIPLLRNCTGFPALTEHGMSDTMASWLSSHLVHGSSTVFGAFGRRTVADILHAIEARQQLEMSLEADESASGV